MVADVLDGHPLIAYSVKAGIHARNIDRTLVSTVPFDLIRLSDLGNHPLVLNSGDTLAIRTVSPAATGTWYMSVAMEWLEAVAY